MAAKKLILLPEHTYHIYHHAVGEENLFKEEQHYYLFLDKYNRYINPICETYAYCLMPNHLHCVVRFHDTPELIKHYKKIRKVRGLDIDINDDSIEGTLPTYLSKSFSNLFNSYTQTINHLEKRKGSLFRQNFNRKIVGDDDYLRYLIAYVHNNPVKDNFVDSIGEWEFSSYNQMKNDNMKDKLLKLYGNRQTFLSDHNNLSLSY